jgi:hypothetical protein
MLNWGGNLLLTCGSYAVLQFLERNRDSLSSRRPSSSGSSMVELCVSCYHYTSDAVSVWIPLDCALLADSDLHFAVGLPER